MTLARMPHGEAGEDDYFVQFRADSTFCSGAASGFDREARGLSDLIRAYPEHETDHGTTLYPTALVGGWVSPRSGCTARLRQFALKGLVGRRNALTLAVWGEQINPHAPKFRSVSNPMHAVMLPNRSALGDEKIGWASVPE